jgi:hypothetical protein
LQLRYQVLAQLIILAAFIIIAFFSKTDIFATISLLLITPVVIFGGRLLLLVIDFLSNEVTTSLVPTEYRSIPRLAAYYVLITPLLVVLIENSIILSELAQTLKTWQISLAALSLAFLPRVVSYASSIQRARNTLIAVLTPLTLMALVLIVVNPERIIFQAEPFTLSLLGIMPLIAIGDAVLHLSTTLGVTRPLITLESIAQSEVERTIRSQLATYPYDTLIGLLGEANRRNRVETEHAILEALSLAVDQALKERNIRARVAIARGITQSIPRYARATVVLLPFIEHSSQYEVPDVIKEVSGSFGYVLEQSPDKCIHILMTLSHHTSPYIRRVVVDFCWERLASGPAKLRGIFVDVMKEYPRRIWHPIGSLWLDVSRYPERSIMIAEAEHVYGTLPFPRDESVFLETDFLKLLQKAWEIDSRSMNIALAGMVHSKDTPTRYGAVMILAEQSIRDRIADNKEMIETLLADKSSLVRSFANRFLVRQSQKTSSIGKGFRIPVR